MDYTGYVILALGLIPSAVMFYLASETDYHRFQFRARVAGGWNTARMRAQQRVHDEQLDQWLRRSGLKMRASFYQYTRILGTAGFGLIAVVGVFRGYGLDLVIPVAVWFLFGYKKPFPMYYGFTLLQQQAAIQRNNGLYLLYRLMLQEIIVFQDHPIGVNEMLKRQLTRVPVLFPFLEQCLEHWVDDPITALQRFGDDLGTRQAKRFVTMLVQIEEAGIDVALDVFKNNYESFRTDRLTDFKNQLKMRALLATGLTMIGLGAATFDINVVVQAYTMHLFQSAMR